jgi:hypothetical protein
MRLGNFDLYSPINIVGHWPTFENLSRGSHSVARNSILIAMDYDHIVQKLVVGSPWLHGLGHIVSQRKGIDGGSDYLLLAVFLIELGDEFELETHPAREIIAPLEPFEIRK